MMTIRVKKNVQLTLATEILALTDTQENRPHHHTVTKNIQQPVKDGTPVSQPTSAETRVQVLVKAIANQQVLSVTPTQTLRFQQSIHIPTTMLS